VGTTTMPAPVAPAPTAPAQPALDPRLIQKRSILDFLLDDYQNLARRLGTEDRRRVDGHFAAIRELERQVKVAAGTPVATVSGGTASTPASAAPPPSPALGCAKPSVSGGGKAVSGQNDAGDDGFRSTAQAQIDLMVMAMACDLTRVGSLQWSNCGNRIIFRSLGINQTHHDLGHDAAADPLTKINTFYMELFAYLIGKMKQVKEADGTSLLDNSVVLWGNELASGAAHNHGPMPFVIAGSGQGHFRTGRYVAASGGHNALLVSCLQAMGIQENGFGSLVPNSGPLANLT
jgi:hypothetical protein